MKRRNFRPFCLAAAFFLLPAGCGSEAEEGDTDADSDGVPGDAVDHGGEMPDGPGDPARDDAEADAQEDEIPDTCGNSVVEEGEECDDGNDMDGDGCNGSCVFSCHGAGDCDDLNVCTDDTCGPGGSGMVCGHDNNALQCDDEDPCTEADLCSGGICIPGAYVCVCPLRQRLLAVAQVDDADLPSLGITRYEHLQSESILTEDTFEDYSAGGFRPTIELMFLPGVPFYSDEIMNWGGAECMPDQSPRLRQYIVDAGYDPDDYDGFFRLFDAEDIVGQTASNGATCTSVYGGNAFSMGGSAWGLLPANGMAAVTLGWWSWDVGGLAPYMVHEYTHILDSQFEQSGEPRFMNPDTRDGTHATCIDNRPTPDDVWLRSVLTLLESADLTACFPVDWSVLEGSYGAVVCP
jgi:cysteine-rich repeat protein